jgi:hypothetical protein
MAAAVHDEGDDDQATVCEQTILLLLIQVMTTISA